MIRRRGVSVVEYILVLAGIVASCLIAGAFLGAFQARVSGSFGRLGVVARPADQPGERTPTQSPHAVAQEAGGLPAMLGATLVCFALGFGIAAALFLYARRRQKKEAQLAAQRSPRGPADPVVIRRRMLDKRARINQILNHEWESVARGVILVRDLMTTQLKTVPPETPTESLRSLMICNELHHALVTDPAGRLLGIVSDRDLNARDGATAGEIMTRDPAHVPSTTDIRQAMTMMMIRHFSALPVVDDGILTGIITTNDLVATLHCTLTRLAEISRYLQLGQGRAMVERALSKSPEDQSLEPGEPEREVSVLPVAMSPETAPQFDNPVCP